MNVYNIGESDFLVILLSIVKIGRDKEGALISNRLTSIIKRENCDQMGFLLNLFKVPTKKYLIQDKTKKKIKKTNEVNNYRVLL